MSRIRGTNTTPERYIYELLRASGLKFVQHDKSLPGCPDFAFSKPKVAVLVNGDFWHGWRFSVWKHKLPVFWQTKIAATRRRDQKNVSKLKRLGWRVVRIWEHQVEQDAEACIVRIVEAVDHKNVNWERVRRAREALPPLKRRNRLPKP
jgi:DNA mismatch endonuclease (patch repair protein)